MLSDEVYAKATAELQRFARAIVAAAVDPAPQQSGSLRYRVPTSARPAGATRRWRGPYLVVDPAPGEAHVPPRVIAVNASHDQNRGRARRIGVSE